MNSKFLKLLTLTVGILALSAAFVSAEEKKDGKCPSCPCEKEKPKAALVSEEKKDDKCPCDKEKPKAAAGDEEKKDGKCPCDKEKPKA